MDTVETGSILVLGMHRSGTSVVTGALSLLGATPPAKMLPPASDNPSGFWEAASVIGVNDWILNEGGATWYDCLGFDAGALNARTRATALTFIMLCMRSEFGGAPLKLIKDPRLCLLLDLWLPALSAAGSPPAVVLVLRSPDEVAASLAVREDLPLGIGAALWLRYMLDAEFATRGCPRHVLAYDDLLEDWRAALTQTGQRTAITWPVGLDSAAAAMDRFVDARLRHFGPDRRQTTAVMPLIGWLEEVTAALHGLVRDGADRQQLLRLDRVRAAFQTWHRAHGRAWTETLLRGHAIRDGLRYEVPAAWHRIASDMPNAIRFPVS